MKQNKKVSDIGVQVAQKVPTKTRILLGIVMAFSIVGMFGFVSIGAENIVNFKKEVAKNKIIQRGNQKQINNFENKFVDLCEKRELYLYYEPVINIRPDEKFILEIYVDQNDCSKYERNDFKINVKENIDYKIEHGSIILEGLLKDKGNHTISGEVEDNYGKTPFMINVYVSDEKMTVKEIRKNIYPELYQESNQEQFRERDGIRKRKVLLMQGSDSERFWIDTNLAYHVLHETFNISNEDIILLTKTADIPASIPNFDISWIDDLISIETISDVFMQLSSELDEDDLLLISYDGHGSGYYGPRTRRPYWNAPFPNTIIQSFVFEEELDNYDDPDYQENEFQTEFIQNGRKNCAVTSDIPKALNIFLPCFDIYPKWIESGDRIYRFKLVSHFENLELIDGSIISNDDIYIEEIINYAECDTNRNTIIEENEIEGCDWEGVSATEDVEWSMDYELIENYHPYNRINGKYYCFFDRNLDNTLDMMAFESSDDSLYLDCLARTANVNNLIVTASDMNNNGYSNYYDINLDGDLDDWLSFDEILSFGSSISDDEIYNLISLLNEDVQKIFLTQSCFGGGFLRDLSNSNMISMSASEEDDTSVGNSFIRNIFMSLNLGCDQFGSSIDYPGYDCEASWFVNNYFEGLDFNENDYISFSEVFKKTYEKSTHYDYPQFDDNADLKESYGGELTFIHQLSENFNEEIIPEGIQGDTIFLDEEFFGDVSQVSCYDFDRPLNFVENSKVISEGIEYNDSFLDRTSTDFVCDGNLPVDFSQECMVKCPIDKNYFSCLRDPMNCEINNGQIVESFSCDSPHPICCLESGKDIILNEENCGYSINFVNIYPER
jgi:hypothetical protein